MYGNVTPALTAACGFATFLRMPLSRAAITICYSSATDGERIRVALFSGRDTDARITLQRELHPIEAALLNRHLSWTFLYDTTANAGLDLLVFHLAASVASGKGDSGGKACCGTS